MTTRLFFIGEGRIADAVLTLQFEYNLDPLPNKTVIHHKPAEEEIKRVFDQYNIDYSKFSFVQDQVLLDQFYKNTNCNLEKIIKVTELHSWVVQQLLKLSALDLCEDKQVVISDCDVLHLRTRQYFKNNQPCLLVSDDIKDPIWDFIVQDLTGINSISNRNFVSEFFPILKTQWQELKEQIENQHGCFWMNAVVKSILSYPDRSFSEYQLLGNWLLKYDVELIEKCTSALHDHKDIDLILERNLLKQIKSLNHFLTTGIEFDQIPKVKSIIERCFK